MRSSERISFLCRLASDDLVATPSELRNSLDTLRLETDKQASSHLALAQSLRTECENPTSEFALKQASHRKNHMVTMERFYKNKQTQEG